MKKFLFSLIFLFSFYFTVYGEKVVMNDGTEYEGNIHYQDNSVVFIVQKDDLIKLQKADIKEIVEDKNKKKDSLTINDDTQQITNIWEGVLQIGYDFYGSYSHKYSPEETDSSKGVTFGAKGYCFFENIVGIGAGINLQNSRKLEDINGRFYFVPTYVSLKIRSIPTKPYKYGYIVGNLGYNMFFADSDYCNFMEKEKGGIYYGIGVGIVYNRVVFEVASSVHNASARTKTTKRNFDIEYKTYTCSLGYIF